MDFLLLLPHGVRVVIEVDGKHHYAKGNGMADVHRYAQTMAADRDLKLAGYEVYRFGAAELQTSTAENDVKVFLCTLQALWHSSLVRFGGTSSRYCAKSWLKDAHETMSPPGLGPPPMSPPRSGKMGLPFGIHSARRNRIMPTDIRLILRKWDFDLNSATLGSIRFANFDVAKKFTEFAGRILSDSIDGVELARNVLQSVARRRTGDAALDAECAGPTLGDDVLHKRVTA